MRTLELRLTPEGMHSVRCGKRFVGILFLHSKEGWCFTASDFQNQKIDNLPRFIQMLENIAYFSLMLTLLKIQNNAIHNEGMFLTLENCYEIYIDSQRNLQG